MPDKLFNQTVVTSVTSLDGSYNLFVLMITGFKIEVLTQFLSRISIGAKLHVSLWQRHRVKVEHN